MRALSCNAPPGTQASPPPQSCLGQRHSFLLGDLSKLPWQVVQAFQAPHWGGLWGKDGQAELWMPSWHWLGWYSGPKSLYWVLHFILLCTFICLIFDRNSDHYLALPGGFTTRQKKLQVGSSGAFCTYKLVVS